MVTNEAINNAKFSVAMSIYKNDSAEYFSRAFESIWDQQTVKPTEIILIIDGPIPSELQETISLKAQSCSILKTIQLEQNRGLGNALKIAIENCSYELIARMDSDDVSSPTRFEEQLSYMLEHPNVDIVGGNITEFIDTETNIVGKRVVPLNHDEINKYMKSRCAFNHVTVMYKKYAVLSCGGYLEWFWNEDYYLWIRMMEKNCNFANIESVLVNVRVGKDMYKRRGGKKYYQSEISLQKYMKSKSIISTPTYIVNCTKRFIIQILLPASIRGWVFRKFARKSK